MMNLSTHDVIQILKEPQTELSELGRMRDSTAKEANELHRELLCSTIDNMLPLMHPGRVTSNELQKMSIPGASESNNITESSRLRMSLHAVATYEDTKASICELILFPHGLSDVKLAHDALRFVNSYANTWPPELKRLGDILHDCLRHPLNAPSALKVTDYCAEKDTTTTVDARKSADFMSALTTTKPVLLIGNNRLHMPPNDASLDVIRAHRDAMFAARSMGLAPQTFVFDTEAGSISIALTPTTAPGYTYDISSNVLYLPEKDTSRRTPLHSTAPSSSIVITATGIQSDSNLDYPTGACKKLTVRELHAQHHRELGAHPKDLVSISAEQIAQAAYNIGRIHLMTQIGKALLKARTQHTEHTAALISEQRGAHLKDEVRLCRYWQQIHAALNKPELECFSRAVRSLGNRGTFQFECKDGTLEQTCAPVHLEDEKRKTAHLQGTHHVCATVHIAGSTTVPLKTLNCGKDSVRVYISNDWNIESNSISFC